MTQWQIDLIKKEQDQFLTLEMGLITQFMEAEQKQMNYPSFPLSKVTQDLEKELDLDFSHDNNVVHEKKLMPKDDINNLNDVQTRLVSNVSYRKVYSPTKVKVQNLTNISYNRVKDVDITNNYFIIDCYMFILFCLNPFYLE